MPSGREELRRGVRDLIETASREMGELVDSAPPPPVIESRDATASASSEIKPVLRLVRPGSAPSVGPGSAIAPHMPPAVEASGVHTRRGVCTAYYISRRCWEVPDAYCNQALHVCMLRECPVYHLNREQLEERFSRKFAHLW
ncbi:MAG: hypothetical protein ACT4PY_09415 [Armatimonadota bacterium]